MKINRGRTLTSGLIFLTFAAVLAACSGNRNTSSAASASGSPAAVNAASTSVPSLMPTPPTADGDPVGPRRYSSMKSPAPPTIPLAQAQAIPQSCMLNSDQCAWTIYLQTDYVTSPSPSPFDCSSQYCFQIVAKMVRDEENAAGLIGGTTEPYNLAMTVSAQPGAAPGISNAGATQQTPGRRGDPIRHRRYTNMNPTPPAGPTQAVQGQGISAPCMRDYKQCTWTIHLETSKKPKTGLDCYVSQCFSIDRQMTRTELPYAGYQPAPNATFWLRMTVSASP